MEICCSACAGGISSSNEALGRYSEVAGRSIRKEKCLSAKKLYLSFQGAVRNSGIDVMIDDNARTGCQSNREI
jgi:hypothetical protein